MNFVGSGVSGEFFWLLKVPVWLFMVSCRFLYFFQGSRSVFHGARSVFMVFSRFQVYFSWFKIVFHDFFMVPGLVFMIPDGFYRYKWFQVGLNPS